MFLADLNEHWIFSYQNLDLKELTFILSASWLFDSLVSVFGTITPSEGRKNQEFTFAGIIIRRNFAEVLDVLKQLLTLAMQEAWV